MRSRYIATSASVQDFRTRFYYQRQWSDEFTSELSFFGLLEVFGFLGGLTRGLESDSMEEMIGFCSVREWEEDGLSIDRLAMVNITSEIADESEDTDHEKSDMIDLKKS